MSEIEVIKVKGSERVLNCLESEETDEYTQETGMYERAAFFAERKKIDYRRADWDIGDQGSTGSCVGWAVADSFLRWYFFKRNLKKKFSPRYIWMASKEFDNIIRKPTTFIEFSGTQIVSAIEIAYRYGVVPWKILPFDGPRFKGKEDEFYNIASEYRIRRKITLKNKLLGGIEKMREYLLDGNGPVVTRLNVDKQFIKAKKNKCFFDKYDPSTIKGGHAIALVGYVDDHFIIRNSWGTDWGENGFAYASEDYADKAFTEAYGVEI